MGEEPVIFGRGDDGLDLPLPKLWPLPVLGDAEYPAGGGDLDAVGAVFVAGTDGLPGLVG